MRQRYIFTIALIFSILLIGTYGIEANNKIIESNSIETTQAENKKTETNSNATESNAILTEISIVERQIELYTQKLDSLKKLHAYCISKNIKVPVNLIL